MIYKIYTLNLYIYIHTDIFTVLYFKINFEYSGVQKSESTTENCACKWWKLQNVYKCSLKASDLSTCPCYMSKGLSVYLCLMFYLGSNNSTYPCLKLQQNQLNLNGRTVVRKIIKHWTEKGATIERHIIFKLNTVIFH